MKRITKYRIMSSILASTIFIGGYIQKAINASASTVKETSSLVNPEFNKSNLHIVDPDETKLPLEEFLNSIEQSQVRKLYSQLYELYDYETFNSNSKIPQYFQTVYGNKFSCGTIQSAGCGISSLAMVSSYLFDEVITPDMMTVFDSGPSPAAALEKGIKRLKLNCEIHRGQAAIDNVDVALDSGHPVIALVGRSSIFTGTGHFIVLSGKTNDGKYIVNDPNIENYYNPRLIDGFKNGFTKKEITQGLKGLYVFDKKDEFVDNRNRELSVKSIKKTDKTDNTNYCGQTNQETSMRTSDSENHPIITNLAINSEVVRLLSTGNGWDLVKSNGYVGYIRTENVSYSKDIAVIDCQHYKHNDIVIPKYDIDLKSSPAKNSSSLLRINQSSELEVISITENGWLTVRYNDKVGYINSTDTESLLEKAQSLYPELQLSELSVSKTIYMKQNTDLRCGNSIEFSAIDSLSKYETAKVLGEYDNWYFVLTSERNFGFISKDNSKILEDKCLVVDKSNEQLYYYNEGEQIYSTRANNIKKFSPSRSGFYSILNKKLNLILYDTHAGWQNIFSNAAPSPKNYSDEIASRIYQDLDKGSKVLVHK